MKRALQSTPWIGLATILFGFALPSGLSAFCGQEQASLQLQLRQRVLKRDTAGYADWQVVTTPKSFPTTELALLICDMWDKHWSRGATERADQLAPRINHLASSLRSLGVLIIHSPSDTMDRYADSPARLRALEFPTVRPEILRAIELPPLPIDDSDGGSDTGEKPWFKAWSRQHPSIVIDPARDVVSESGEEIYSILQGRGIGTLLYTGVHVNMCVLKTRSFSLKPMAEKGVEVILVRDLTDSMYNPERPPYVSHEEGTRLVIEYIEKFLSPTVKSDQIIEATRSNKQD